MSASSTLQQREHAGAGPGDVDVLAVIDHLAMGGAEMLLGRFAAAAPLAGIRLSVAYFEPNDGAPAAQPLREAGVEPWLLNVSGRPGRAHLRAMREHIRRVRPDVVHTHLGTADLVGGVAARSLGVPAVSTIHWIAQRRHGIARAKNGIFTLGRRLCDARVIAVSESAREAYLAQSWRMGERVVTIHNGIDVDIAPGAGAEVRAELGIDPGYRVIGMVSALRPEKGHEVALAAIGMLRERGMRDARLVIVGDGPLLGELERAAAKADGAVVLTGRRMDVPRVLDAFDVCVHPSHLDAFPTTLIEALAASVPIVATRVGGIPEIVQDGRTGVLLPAPPQAADLADALERLLADPAGAAELAAAGRAEYLARFTSEPWVRATRALYDEVLAGAPRRAGPGAR